MGKFDYTALNKDKKTVSGSVEASDKNGATKLLRDQGLTPLSIKAQKTGFDPNNIQLSFLTKKKPKGKDLVVFTRQLSTMISAGVPLVRSLNTLQQQAGNAAFKETIGKIAKEVESGKSFGDSLEKFPESFSEVYVNMVRAGEAGGILDEILNRLAFQQEKDASIKKKLKSAMTYPAVLLVITILAFFAIMIFVIPKIGEIITDLGGEDAQLPIQTQAMLAISNFMINSWPIMIGGMVGGIVAIRRYIKTPKGKINFHRFLLKVPVVKTVVTKVAIARFARIFSSLMSSGVAVLEAINITAEALGNKVIEKDLKDAAKEVTAGKQLSEPLAASPVFPPIVAQMMAVGEETGQTDTVLVKIADFYEEEVDALVDGMSSIIEPIMIAVMGAMVGLIAASVIGPISELSSTIG